MTMAAIYARVSSDRQKEEDTIGSQLAALNAYARSEAFSVPEQWIFQDEGYSGATLVRPGLERLRDLVCEGSLEAVLIYSPDRLSRKYAYQVLLIDEFTRHGVAVVFTQSAKASSPEEQLLLQFQGMIAEYERAQITERIRRGKRFRAKSGLVNVLSGAPYGYKYIKKTERSSAYKGTACFGKTRSVERKKITRPLRKRGGYSPYRGAHQECQNRTQKYNIYLRLL